VLPIPTACQSTQTPILQCWVTNAMTDQVACQFAENDFCNQMLSYLSGQCGRGATEQFEQDFGDDLCPKCAAKEIPTMDELDSEKDDILG